MHRLLDGALVTWMSQSGGFLGKNYCPDPPPRPGLIRYFFLSFHQGEYTTHHKSAFPNASEWETLNPLGVNWTRRAWGHSLF